MAETINNYNDIHLVHYVPSQMVSINSKEFTKIDQIKLFKIHVFSNDVDIPFEIAIER